MSSLGYTEATLASAVADGGTVTVSYPAGLNQAALTDSDGGAVAINSNDVFPQGTGAGTVAFAFGASNITVTNNSGVTWPAGASLTASFGSTGQRGGYNLDTPQSSIADPTGGSTVDAEARTAIGSIIDALQAAGIIN